MPRNSAHAYEGRTNGRMQRSLAKASKGLANRLTLERMAELLQPHEEARPTTPDDDADGDDHDG
jgi:hypothetical protein